MHFQATMTLARATPIPVLCEVWEATPEHVNGRLCGETPMNLREAGDLAAWHGLLLEHILSAGSV